MVPDFKDLPIDPVYTAAWARLKKLTYWLWGTVAFWMVGMTGLVLFGASHRGFNPIFIQFLVAPYVIVMMTVSLKLGRFRCPRCGERYFVSPNRLGRYSRNTAARQCRHCGLPRNAPSDPGPTPLPKSPTVGEVVGEVSKLLRGEKGAKVKCPNGHELAPGSVYCPQCGAVLQ
jgi:hypothetical protein